MFLAAADFSNRFNIQTSLNNNKDLVNDTNVDDWIQFAPLGAVYFFDLTNKNPFWERTKLLLKSELLMVAIVRPLKVISQLYRPENRDRHSMPSGHTAQAFVAATFMHKELGDKSIWYSIAAYSAATSVETLRILGNRHWLGDALVGAGIGILTTNLVYSHNDRKQRKSKLLKNTTFCSDAKLKRFRGLFEL